LAGEDILVDPDLVGAKFPSPVILFLRVPDPLFAQREDTEEDVLA
jgi:hypothetical protein